MLYLKKKVPLSSSFLSSLNYIPGFDASAFLKAQSEAAVLSVRKNPLKANGNEDVAYRDQMLHPVPWCPDGFYLKERPFFIFDPALHAGLYYVQEASSMFLWEALRQTCSSIVNPRVLDLCAAPGGKTTLLSSFFSNGGLIVANELVHSRLGALEENTMKWGSDNIWLSSLDPSRLSPAAETFDVVLVDAPCSGSGLFRKMPTMVDQWNMQDVMLCQARQKRIIHDILPVLKPGGILIYSTCSFSREEDEDIADEILEDSQFHCVKLNVDTNWSITETHLSSKGAWGYHFMPERLKGEGFFLSVFRKEGTLSSYPTSQIGVSGIKLAERKDRELIASFVKLPSDWSILQRGSLFCAVRNQDLSFMEYLYRGLAIPLRKTGVTLGCIKGHDFIPDEDLALSRVGNAGWLGSKIDLDCEKALSYLRKELQDWSVDLGWNLICYQGHGLGWAKGLKGRVNNVYPPKWRIIKKN